MPQADKHIFRELNQKLAWTRWAGNSYEQVMKSIRSSMKCNKVGGKQKPLDSGGWTWSCFQTRNADVFVASGFEMIQFSAKSERFKISDSHVNGVWLEVIWFKTFHSNPKDTLPPRASISVRSFKRCARVLRNDIFTRLCAQMRGTPEVLLTRRALQVMTFDTFLREQTAALFVTKRLILTSAGGEEQEQNVRLVGANLVLFSGHRPKWFWNDRKKF